MGLNSLHKRISQEYRAGKKSFAVLVDPDKAESRYLDDIVILAERAHVDYLFVGGSLLSKDNMEPCLKDLRARTDIPLILFPGSNMHISSQADAILFLSLISGRNPELLIGQHVAAAPFIRQAGLEAIPTGYMLVDGGVSTAVSYISNTIPIPREKSDIAVCTALAGEMLGMKMLYLDAGSGAKHAVPPKMIQAIRKEVDLPIICGGGIRTPEEAQKASRAGADIVVVGNAIEKDPVLLVEIAKAIHADPAEIRP